MSVDKILAELSRLQSWHSNLTAVVGTEWDAELDSIDHYMTTAIAGAAQRVPPKEGATARERALEDAGKGNPQNKGEA